MSRVSQVLKILLAFTVAGIASTLAVGWVHAEDSMFGFTGSGVPTRTLWPQITAMAVLMVFGCLASAVWNNIPYASSDGPPPRVHLKRAIALAISSPSFVRSVIASPVTFGAVYVASQSEADDIAVYLLAFQNGFFWDVILQSRRPKDRNDD